jgi:hypothetical protein
MPLSSSRTEGRACRALIVAMFAFASACGGDGPGMGPPATGSLSVIIEQASATPGSVRVAGPVGYSHTLASTATLARIRVRIYSITAATYEVPDPIVGGNSYSSLITGSPQP